MSKLKSYKMDDFGAPDFGSNFKVIEQVVLNYTNIDGNNNKFYSMELQESDGNFRIYTHYGRVGVEGVKEGRYVLKDEAEEAQEMAEKEFQSILKSKKKKGYVPVEFAVAEVGSGKAKQNGYSGSKKASCSLDKEIQKFVEQIYEEASQSLSSTIKTPLGSLSESQIDKGFEKLGEIRKGIKRKDRSLLTELSSQYYSLIPQRFSHRIDADEVVIDSCEKADRQEELLQLMRDVYNVKDDLNSDIMRKYRAININVELLDKSDPEYRRIERKVKETQSSHHSVDLYVNNVYKVELQSVKGRFNPKKLEKMELFHGSANKNILGILQRGLLIAPPCASFNGAAFGRGIYFARHSTKSAQYSTKFYSNMRDNGFLFLADVAVGRMQELESYTYNDNGPDYGYDSVRGVAGRTLIHDEYIVYNANQVEIKYVVDFTPKNKTGRF